jgi:hypothetical protein
MLNSGKATIVWLAIALLASGCASTSYEPPRLADGKPDLQGTWTNVITQPWRAEMVFNATEGPIYEYACHEGNYALPNILGGARQEESAP